eukprot:2818721-Amphidinium_carterae.1
MPAQRRVLEAPVSRSSHPQRRSYLSRFISDSGHITTPQNMKTSGVNMSVMEYISRMLESMKTKVYEYWECTDCKLNRRKGPAQRTALHFEPTTYFHEKNAKSVHGNCPNSSANQQNRGANRLTEINKRHEGQGGSLQIPSVRHAASAAQLCFAQSYTLFSYVEHSDFAVAIRGSMVRNCNASHALQLFGELLAVSHKSGMLQRIYYVIDLC